MSNQTKPNQTVKWLKLDAQADSILIINGQQFNRDKIETDFAS